VSEPNKLDRRDFVKVVLVFIGTIITACIGIPAIGYLLSPALAVQKKEAWIPLGPLENYPIGTPTLYSFTRTTVNGWEKTVNSYGVYVVRSDETNCKVLSNKCTHLSCRVTWNEDRDIYICPCHDGHFAIDGQVVYGPPPAPLKEFETKVENGDLYIYFVEGA
jgi:quinol---cytochrome c reductase iron-sulfur subunit, bacillus type